MALNKYPVMSRVLVFELRSARPSEPDSQRTRISFDSSEGTDNEATASEYRSAGNDVTNIVGRS